MSDTYAVINCPNCKEKTPANVHKFTKPKHKDILAVECCICNKVINLGQDIKVEYVTEKELNKMGYFKE